MYKNVRTAVVVLFLIGAPATAAVAANWYIRPGASGTGADWTNARGSLPTTLVRGDTYYLADGNYGTYTFDDAENGTQTITIKKATASDHGTSSGWDNSYGDGQAVFGEIKVYTDFYTFDGQRRNADWRRGTISEYGIRIKGAGGKPVRLDNGAGQGADNLTFRFVDIEGAGRHSGTGDDAVYGLTGNSDITFDQCAIHDTDRTMFLMRGNWKNLTVSNCYLARNTSTTSVHGELLSSTDVTNMTFRNNVIEDIEGTAVWAGLNGGAWNGVHMHGNVIGHTPGWDGQGVAALIFVANDAENPNSASGLRFFNNTIANLRALWSGIHIEAGSNNEVRNNVWYSSSGSDGLGTQGVAVQSHNWYYNTSPHDGDASSTKVVCTSGCNVFASASSRDFRLTSPLPGLSLDQRYAIDPNGNTRGADGVWDRGAFDYGNSVAPLPPQNLQVQ